MKISIQPADDAEQAVLDAFVKFKIPGAAAKKQSSQAAVAAWLETEINQSAKSVKQAEVVEAARAEIDAFKIVVSSNEKLDVAPVADADPAVPVKV